MKYPEVLGRWVAILPEKYQTAEWFDTLPEHIQNQFYRTTKRFPSEVAAEYLRDNHGCDDNQELKPIKKQLSSFGYVKGIIYAKNTFKFFWKDGPKYYHLKNNPARWAFVGYIDIGDDRIVRTARDSSCLRNKLKLVIKKALQTGVSKLGIGEPMIFNLTLTISEGLPPKVLEDAA